MRYDKYDGTSGGFRALLAADWGSGKVGTAYGVGLDSDGQVVAGDGLTGVVGVLVVNEPKNAADVVDVMTAGEVVDCDYAAGTVYYAATDGSLSTTNTDTPIGFTAEADRLIVRVTS